MTSKERVYTALRFQEPDRVPRFVWLGSGTVKKLTEKTGLTPLELSFQLGQDILQTWLSINGEMEREIPEGGSYVDEWGITWKRQDLYNMVVKHPLQGKGIDDISGYRLPDPHSGERYQYLEHLIRKFGATHFIGADVSGVLFEPAYHLRNMEDLMIDMALDSPAVTILLDKLTEFCIAVSIECLRRGADWIWLGDDLGSQKGMLMSPQMWRQFYKPRMKRIIDAIKAYKKEAYIAYHSCGSMYPVIGDLVEIGINVLNPVQESAAGMDQEMIKREFGSRITLMCGPDTQQFLLSATPQQVKEKTHEIIAKLNIQGGFIFAVSHTIQPDIPAENIEALFEALGKVEMLG